jgi:hypothetical protein
VSAHFCSYIELFPSGRSDVATSSPPMLIRLNSLGLTPYLQDKLVQHLKNLESGSAQRA